MKKLKSILLLGFLLVLVGCSPKKFDLSQSIDMIYMGYEGQGVAMPQLNETDILAFQNDNWKTDGSFSPLLYLYEGDAYTFDIEPNGTLSNGDIVKVSVNVNNEKAKEYFSGGEFESTVSGLTQPTIITNADVWDKLELDLSGYNGSGILRSLGTNSFGYTGIVDVDAWTENLSNGDIVTLEISEEKLSLFPNVVFEGDRSFEYHVSGLPETIELTEAELMDGLDLDNVFSVEGGNGKGTIKDVGSIRFDYQDRTHFLEYEIMDNGSFSNGDDAIINITQEYVDYLITEGLILPNNGQIKWRVKNLVDYPEDIRQVANFEEVKNKFIERSKQSYYEGEIVSFVYQQHRIGLDYDRVGINEYKHNHPGTLFLIYSQTEKGNTEPDYYSILSAPELVTLENGEIDLSKIRFETERVEVDEDIRGIIDALKENGGIEFN